MTRIRPFGIYQAIILGLVFVIGAPEIFSGRRLFAVSGFSFMETEPASQSAPSNFPSYSIRWISDSANTSHTVVEVKGLSRRSLNQLRRLNWKPADWQRLLAVAVEQPATTATTPLPPMLGAYRIEADTLRFTPQFPLQPGLSYQAIFRAAHLPDKHERTPEMITSRFQLPPRSLTPTTAVTQIYPTAETLPENLLKFYVQFSAPMSRGQIYDHIHLLDSSGKAVDLPFLQIDEELWDTTMTRLTLFIDPGRIKRGVLPLEEVGAALEEGKRFTLVIDSAWKDGSGNPLKESFRKSFQVGAPDRDPPDPAHWKIESPKPGTHDGLTVIFPEPMDFALAQRLIFVVDQSGKVVAGQIRLTDRERRWTFIPREPWRPSTYQLTIQTTIEDLAGNNIGKPFDVDLFETVERRITTATLKLPFEVH